MIANKKSKVLDVARLLSLSERNLYLSVFIDLFSRKVVGWSMNKRMREDIVIDACLQACGKEHPLQGLIVHTDQGSQYTAQAFRNIVENNGGILSNSRKGNPYDNAIMESFYKTLKESLLTMRDTHIENKLIKKYLNTLKSITIQIACVVYYIF